MSTLEKRVVEILSRAALVPEHTLTRDADLASLGVGSLEQIECVMAIEDELQIEIPVADLRNLRTVGDVIDAIRLAAGDVAPR